MVIATKIPSKIYSYVCYTHMNHLCAGALRCKNRYWIRLKLKLQMTVSHYVGARPKSGSLQEQKASLNCKAYIQPQHDFFLIWELIIVEWFLNST